MNPGDEELISVKNILQKMQYWYSGVRVSDSDFSISFRFRGVDKDAVYQSLEDKMVIAYQTRINIQV